MHEQHKACGSPNSLAEDSFPSGPSGLVSRGLCPRAELVLYKAAAEAWSWRDVVFVEWAAGSGQGMLLVGKAPFAASFVLTFRDLPLASFPAGWVWVLMMPGSSQSAG